LASLFSSNNLAFTAFNRVDAICRSLRLVLADFLTNGTLSRIVGSLGGRLEIIAHMPGGDIALTQFTKQLQ
jgi:hypothetical protein